MLTLDGRAVDLSPRLVESLAHIVSHGGEIVTKDELLERFWPDVHVTENTLTRAIADIRKAIGDNAARPKYLETASRRGYRFIAPAPDAPDPFEEAIERAARLDIPTNFAAVPSKNGVRLSMLAGFNTRRR